MQVLNDLVHELARFLRQVNVDCLAGIRFLQLSDAAHDHGNHNRKNHHGN